MRSRRWRRPAGAPRARSGSCHQPHARREDGRARATRDEVTRQLAGPRVLRRDRAGSRLDAPAERHWGLLGLDSFRV
ncbi:hypothetical protein DB32_008621 [Sandaracinus amylolyticus]|uniref:Uncharacterized protein n=1 Tax=Sandaracinus amylolyticus TaxID=927083 RepID=A0A0F6YPH2_9BACT|nr:hypothetical protein DB32_008621 [Sandaracinus amylolyticus]